MLLITVATMALPGSRPSACIGLGAHQHHRVTVHDTAAGVDEDRTVTVAVERDAQLVPAVHDHLPETAGRRGAALQVDVAAIRFVADDGRLETEVPEDVGSHRAGSAIRTIDRDAALHSG
jgi:hypothetical protein